MAADHSRDAQDVPQVFVDLTRLRVGVNRPVRDATRDLVVVVALIKQLTKKRRREDSGQSTHQHRLHNSSSTEEEGVFIDLDEK